MIKCNIKPHHIAKLEYNFFLHVVSLQCYQTDIARLREKLIMLWPFPSLFQLDGLKLTFKKNRRKRKKEAGLCWVVILQELCQRKKYSYRGRGFLVCVFWAGGGWPGDDAKFKKNVENQFLDVCKYFSVCIKEKKLNNTTWSNIGSKK